MAKATGDYKRLIERTEKGKATFGRGNQYDVDRLVTTEDVLELKWESLPPKYGSSPYVGLRLYFAEPVSDPGLLLKLKLVCKVVDTEEQNADASECQERFTRWNDERRDER